MHVESLKEVVLLRVKKKIRAKDVLSGRVLAQHTKGPGFHPHLLSPCKKRKHILLSIESSVQSEPLTNIMPQTSKYKP
jgi:hypothetical protein